MDADEERPMVKKKKDMKKKDMKKISAKGTRPAHSSPKPNNKVGPGGVGDEHIKAFAGI